MYLPSAPPSVEIYGINDGFFFINAGNMVSTNWYEAQALCQAQNGVIAYLEYERVKLLLQSVQYSMAWTGLTYDSVGGVWRDHLGNVPQNVKWKAGEPDGVNVFTYFTIWSDGYVSIWPDYSDAKAALCAYT